VQTDLMPLSFLTLTTMAEPLKPQEPK
jgi:hypothetical protein